MSAPLTWVIERGIFEGGGASFAEIARRLGQQVSWWDDLWWTTERWPRLEGQQVCFRGNLSNAQQVVTRTAWRPGEVLKWQRSQTTPLKVKPPRPNPT